MFTPTYKKQFSVLLMAVVLAFTACDRSLDPFEDEEGIYSVYGALEVGKEQNIIRVRNSLEPFLADSTFPFDATVTFTDLQSGNTTQLPDTIVNFEVGRTQNYILREILQLDSQYQITVSRSDGAQVTSIATTPSLTEVSLIPSAGIFCETPIQFQFKNAKESELVEMEIGATYDGDIHWAEMDLVGEIEYDPILDLHKVKMSPRNLLVEIFTPILPDDPFLDPYRLFPTVRCNELDTNILMIKYFHYGPEWQTGRPIDRGAIDPDSGSIENGIGFFGAYRTDTFSIEISQP